jgi:phage-related protein
MADSRIRICQFFKLQASDGRLYRYQNFFIGEDRTYRGEVYTFAPFQADGALSSLNGENQQMRVLFPSLEIVLRLVEAADGNRLSELELTTAWLADRSNQIVNTFTDFFVGTGATFNEDTVELRFRSAMDSVGASFPARTFTADNAGILPLNAELYLQ